MNHEYLGLVEYTQALARQEMVRASGVDVALGFESEPIITLGVRSNRADLVNTPLELARDGFEVLRVDRGGQATLHNPGQLVIFPVVTVGDLGARGWVNLLARVTALTLDEFGVSAAWDQARPGLYTERGKIAAMGVRLRDGVSTHGISINVHNNLADFARIRACGVASAAVDSLRRPEACADVFEAWIGIFEREWSVRQKSDSALSEELTSPPNLPNLDVIVRS